MKAFELTSTPVSKHFVERGRPIDTPMSAHFIEVAEWVHAQVDVQVRERRTAGERARQRPEGSLSRGRASTRLSYAQINLKSLAAVGLLFTRSARSGRPPGSHFVLADFRRFAPACGARSATAGSGHGAGNSCGLCKGFGSAVAAFDRHGSATVLNMVDCIRSKWRGG